MKALLILILMITFACNKQEVKEKPKSKAQIETEYRAELAVIDDCKKFGKLFNLTYHMYGTHKNTKLPGCLMNADQNLRGNVEWFSHDFIRGAIYAVDNVKPYLGN